MSRPIHQAIRQTLKVRGLTQEDLGRMVTAYRQAQNPDAAAVARHTINRALNTSGDIAPLLRDALTVLDLELAVQAKDQHDH